jgi:hypothetical protein
VPVAQSPPIPVNDLIEGPPIGLGDRSQWPIGRIPECDHVRADVVGRISDDPA